VTTGGGRIEILKNQSLPDGGTSSAGNDALVLLTDAKNNEPDSRMSNIGYGVAPLTDKSRQDMVTDTVWRYVQAFRWDEDTANIKISSSKPNAPEIFSQPMAPAILRFELAFVNKDGVVRAAPPSSEDDLRTFHEELASIVCAVATIDAETLQRLSQAERDGIAAKLGNAVDDKSPLEVWQEVDLNELPPLVAKSLRFHQRYFRVK
jgi:hypothetical protein